MGCSAPCAPSPPPAVPPTRPRPRPTTSAPCPPSTAARATTPPSRSSRTRSSTATARSPPARPGPRCATPCSGGSSPAPSRPTSARGCRTWSSGPWPTTSPSSATFVGVILFAQLGPLLLLSMVGGVLADTVDRRRLLICVALTQLVLSFVLAAVAAPERPEPGRARLVVLAIGIGQALFNPAYSAMLPQLVGRDDLPGAISLNSAQMNASRVVGPADRRRCSTRGSAPRRCSPSTASRYLFVVGRCCSVHLPAPEVAPDGPAGAPPPRGGLRRGPARRQWSAGASSPSSCFSFLSPPVRRPVPDRRRREPGHRRAVGRLRRSSTPASGSARSPAPCRSARSSPAARRSASCGCRSSPLGALTVFALLRRPALAYPVVVAVGLAYFAVITSLSTVLQSTWPTTSGARSWRCGSWGSAARCRSATCRRAW